eukprot:gnl/MRDRNA2_/MRDRNA2_86055_c0_seq1.p1 gnl/MRDRNA2_/MRDRNA2_86055_c0~~gnl/MRDRNA2_/MRDRNA2_86055_c0_seq1.p1  ORF type:complete len:551 (-),score=54.13 gnl/MRDRNA2_/MRDRNA2_86055_c0_seq1:911-2563(-)
MSIDTKKKSNDFVTKVSLLGAITTAELVRSTLGPKGMDKLLESKGTEEITITNDGATVLKSILIENPIAKILVDISMIQDDAIGDGTTSVVVLAGELLKESEKLFEQKMHTLTILEGFRKSYEIAQQKLETIVIKRSDNPLQFRKDLVELASTTLASKIIAQDTTHFAVLAVEAVLRLRGSKDLDMIQLLKKKGGSLRDSFIDEGFILDKKMGIGQPSHVKNAAVLLANTSMDGDRIKISGAKVISDTTIGIAEIETAEKDRIKEKCNKIISHGINCFINRQLIYDYPEQLFTNEHVISIEHADFDGIERLSKVLNCDIVSTFERPDQVKIGHCKLIEEVHIGTDSVIHFSGVEKGEACTIVLRGGSSQVLDEAERSMHDTICVLIATVEDFRITYGGGYPEMKMGRAIDLAAAGTPGKQSLAMQSYAKSLRQIPAIIADNAGMDSSEILTALCSAHEQPDCKIGFDAVRCELGTVENRGIIESCKVKEKVLQAAQEATECILRIDYIFHSQPKQRTMIILCILFMRISKASSKIVQGASAPDDSILMRK